jgi:hypothetical protein
MYEWWLGAIFRGREWVIRNLGRVLLRENEMVRNL